MVFTELTSSYDKTYKNSENSLVCLLSREVLFLFSGNRKQTEERLNRRSNRNKSDKANKNRSRECIEIDDDDSEENKIVGRNTRKTPKQKNRVTKETPKNEVKTAGKIAQIGG